MSYSHSWAADRKFTWYELFGYKDPTKLLKLPIMSKGAELITQERLEQINKHGWNATDKDYVNQELIQAAWFTMNPDLFAWPDGWQDYFKNKIKNKTHLERLTVAGAFIAAEIDRILKQQENDNITTGQDSL